MEQEYNYIPLSEPMPIAEQVWPEGTPPLVCTSTLAYNHESYIRDCLDGILMQKTTFPVQVLVHDDCSTDNTAAILKEYQEKYPKLIKVYYQPENVYSLDPSEKIRRRAEFYSWQIGKYIALCEGDDYWTDPLKLQKQVIFMDTHLEYSACTHRYMTLDDRHLKLKCFIPFKNRVTLNDLVFEIPFQTATVLYRKSAEVSPPIEYLPYMRDTFLFMILAEHGDFFVMDDVMSVYRIHSGGVWSRLSRVEQVLSKEAYQLKIIEYFSSHNQPVAELLKFKLSQYCVRMSLSCLFAFDFKGCLFCLKNSFKYSKGLAQVKEYSRLLKKAVLYVRYKK